MSFFSDVSTPKQKVHLHNQYKACTGLPGKLVTLFSLDFPIRFAKSGVTETSHKLVRGHDYVFKMGRRQEIFATGLQAWMRRERIVPDYRRGKKKLFTGDDVSQLTVASSPVCTTVQEQ